MGRVAGTAAPVRPAGGAVPGPVPVVGRARGRARAGAGHSRPRRVTCSTDRDGRRARHGLRHRAGRPVAHVPLRHQRRTWHRHRPRHPATAAVTACRSTVRAGGARVLDLRGRAGRQRRQRSHRLRQVRSTSCTGRARRRSATRASWPTACTATSASSSSPPPRRCNRWWLRAARSCRATYVATARSSLLLATAGTTARCTTCAWRTSTDAVRQPATTGRPAAVHAVMPPATSYKWVNPAAIMAAVAMALRRPVWQ